MLDEPDNYISLREIQPWCMNLESELEDNGQCFLISHHPEIIDYMAEANGIWLTRIKSGESSILKFRQKASKNKEFLLYSEMVARGLIDETE